VKEKIFSSAWLRARERKLEYIRREPEKTAIYRVVFNCHEKLEQLWDDRYKPRFGRFRSELREAFYKFLDCGILLHGCARARCKSCKSCNHTILIPLSCKARGICASCDTKRMLLFAEHLHEEVLEAVPNRHAVLSVAKRIRAYFRYDRSRNKFLFRAAWEAVCELYQEVCPEGIPAAVMALHSGNDLQEHNPHLHGMLADGVFMPDGSFRQISLDPQALQKLFEHKLLSLLEAEGIISQTVTHQLQSWKHSGFSAWLGPRINPDESEARLFISEYVNKAQIKLSKIEILDNVDPLEEVKVRCYKDETTFKDYTPMDFLAQLTALIPNKWEQQVRYLGYYSSRSRGKRRQLANKNNAIAITPEDTEYKKQRRRSWARLIRKVFQVDPLVCPRCGEQMSIIAVITNPKEAKRISSHLGYQYRAPPPLRSSPSGQSHYDNLPNAA